MQKHTSEKFKLVDWQVNPALNQLAIDEKVFELEPKVMQVLVCLKEHAGELVTKDTLFEEVWQGVSISDDAIYCSISKLRKTFRQVEEHRSPELKTISRQGYMLSDSPSYKVLKADSVVTHGRRHDDKLSDREETAAGIVNHESMEVDSSAETNGRLIKEMKRPALDSELKLLNLELFVSDHKKASKAKSNQNRNNRLKIIILFMLIVILIQALIILFV